MNSNPDKFKEKNKLIMTLLVRDEVDIVKYNIDYHLAHGVDFIIATDNGSIDGTREVLREYEDKGLLFLIDEKSQNHSQADWVNRMGKIAYEQYGANIIFHCDADEFWYSRSGDLKNGIQFSKQRVLKVNLNNVLLLDRDGDEKFPIDSKFAVIKPIIASDLEEDSRKENLYLFKYPPKVIFKTDKGFLNVAQGNHSIVNVSNDQIEYSEDIEIFHYPVRSKEQFFSKVINGGSAFEANKELNKKIGWHWRRWYEAYKNGTLEDEYKKLIVTEGLAEKMEKDGRMEKINFYELINNKNKMELKKTLEKNPRNFYRQGVKKFIPRFIFTEIVNPALNLLRNNKKSGE